MKTTTALALAACLLAGSASAQENTPSAAEASFRASAMLDGYARVEYRDAAGKLLDFDAFMKAIAGGGKSISMEKEGDHSLAVVRIKGGDAPKVAPVAHGPAAGTRLPALDAGMATLDGRAFADADLRGHRTLLSLFFSDCVPCVAEVPALNAFAKAHPDIPVVSMTFDDAATAREFVRKRGLEVPVIADAQDYLDRMHIDTYPMLLLVDAQGRIAAVRNGGNIGSDALTQGELERWIGEAD
jgi:thiol-disulfide isomerase/thioredoxin